MKYKVGDKVNLKYTSVDGCEEYDGKVVTIVGALDNKRHSYPYTAILDGKKVMLCDYDIEGLVQRNGIIRSDTDKLSFNKEAVDHPEHYNQGKYEVIDVIEDWKLNFSLGNVIAYVARCEYKNNKKEDLEKAIWYLERELERESAINE